MTPLAFGLLGLLNAAPAACPCPCPPSAASAATILVRPREVAFARNRQGRDLYRQRRFAEARAAYRDALASDPSFLAPRLNIACAFTQEERFAEAVAEATALAQQRYVPWAREIVEAADLAPLAARPEAQLLRAALARAGAGWGASLVDPRQSLLFVARTVPPVRLPRAGTLLLALGQEIFAYLPASGEYRQVTAEGGRVLAFLRSTDGGAVTYVTGGKLVRTPGQPDRLRGLAVRRLDLATMALGPAVVLEGDLLSLQLGSAGPGSGAPGATLHMTSPDGKMQSQLFDGRVLITVPAPAAARLPAPVVRLDANGVRQTPAQGQAGTCTFSARDGTDAAGRPAIVVQPGKGPRFSLAGPEGAGLAGLPFPD